MQTVIYIPPRKNSGFYHYVALGFLADVVIQLPEGVSGICYKGSI